MAKSRRIIQIVFLLFFIFLFLKARYPYSDALSSDLFLRFSPLIPLFHFIENFSLDWLLWPAILILFLTVFFGRFFCGWICPLGTAIDISGKIIKSPSNKLSAKFDKLRYIKFVILIATIILAFFSINVWSFFDPLSIFNRALTVTLYPLATALTETTLLQATQIKFLEDIAYWFYDIFKDVIMPEEQSYLQQIFWISLFFTAILAAEKLSRRFWCRYLCPAGAWLGFLSQFRFYERIVAESCPVCNKCQVECKMNAIPTKDVALTSKVECIECFNCGALCPPKAKSITYRWRWKPYHTSLDLSRRQFISTSAASLAALGLLSVGLQNREDKERRIRPPGSLPEEDFLNRCIRCLECVRICRSNGKCLQPDRIHGNIMELWAPVAVMRGGYCEYNCNLCGLVCPTEAILPLSLDQKKQTPMGLAYFNKNLCIPYAQNKDCLVCEEHCPTPDKAIKFEIKNVILADGSQRAVKYPYIKKQLCIGCGICEDKCPLPGAPGIFVNTDNEKRLTKTDIV
jgi:polyferredoxin/formate hydrogenlyase subunit 6/NADH:ubiquinone oxidoreductase subunit I